MKADKKSIFSSSNITAGQAEEIIQDALPTIEGMDDLPSKSTRNLSVAYEWAKILFEMVKDTYKGEYEALDKCAIATAVLAIIYLASPLDFIPEAIPGVGIVDDIAILTFAAGLCSKEIGRYTEFKRSRESDADIVPVISTDPYK